MKAEILKILQLQEEGKLTREQAAELLAIIADQAREKATETASPSSGSPGTDSPQVPSTGQGGAPGPRGEGPGKDRGFAAQSAAAIHGLVDTAIGVGATIGRAATVVGGEVASMVHREEGGNFVTLSKVDAPRGENYTFRGNTINVSKISNLILHEAQVNGNTINASKVANLDITCGRFSQCNVSGSSVSNVSITGPETTELAPAQTGAGTEASAADGAVGGGAATAAAPTSLAGIRALTFNASKFSRVRVEGASVLETSTIQAAVVKDWSLKVSTLRDSKINDAQVSGLALEQADVKELMIERSHIQGVKVNSATLEKVTLSGVRAADVKFAGGTWKDVKFARESAALGGRESLLHETAFENCDLTGCAFTGCTFRRTMLRNLKLSGLCVRNVDFTGMTLENEADFRRAAGI
jgi:uncharacterized protein YjbI with pentapeptide repeats